MFEALGQRFTSLFSGLRGKVSQAQLVEFSSDIKNALLDSDVALLVADKFSKQVLEEFNNQAESINKSTNPSQKIFEIVNAQLTQILGGSERRLKFAKVAPTVILLTGLQGAGKTSQVASQTSGRCGRRQEQGAEQGQGRRTPEGRHQMRHVYRQGRWPGLCPCLSDRRGPAGLARAVPDRQTHEQGRLDPWRRQRKQANAPTPASTTASWATGISAGPGAPARCA